MQIAAEIWRRGDAGTLLSHARHQARPLRSAPNASDSGNCPDAAGGAKASRQTSGARTQRRHAAAAAGVLVSAEARARGMLGGGGGGGGGGRGAAPVVLVLVAAAVVLVAVVAAGAEPRAPRVRRRLVFLEGTTFWVRLNIKKDILPYTNLFAFAYGFRVNYPLPTGAKDFPFKRIFRRDVYGDLEHLISQHGLDGRACVLRAICEAASLEKPRGLLQKVLHRIFSVPADERRHLQPYHVLEGRCERLHDSCPLSLLHVTVMAAPDEDI